MTGKAISRLNQLISALEDDDAQSISESIVDLTEIYQEGHSRSWFDLERANRATDVVEDQGEFESLQEYIDLGLDVDRERAAFLSGTGAAVHSLDQVELDPLVQAAKEMQSSEETLRATFQDVKDIISNLDIESDVQIIDTDSPQRPVAKGTQFSIGVIIGDTGTTGTGHDEVTLTVEGAFTESDSSEVTVSAGELATETFDIRARKAGSLSSTAELATADINNRTQSSVSILDKLSYLEQTKTQIQTLNEKVSTVSPSQPLVAKVENAEKKIDQAQRAAEKGRAKQANNQIGAAKNILEALMNQLEGHLNGPSRGKGQNKPGSTQNSRVYEEAFLVSTINVVDELLQSLELCEEAAI